MPLQTSARVTIRTAEGTIKITPMGAFRNEISAPKVLIIEEHKRHTRSKSSARRARRNRNRGERK